jgi:hypothetical protein
MLRSLFYMLPRLWRAYACMDLDFYRLPRMEGICDLHFSCARHLSSLPSRRSLSCHIIVGVYARSSPILFQRWMMLLRITRSRSRFHCEECANFSVIQQPNIKFEDTPTLRVWHGFWWPLTKFPAESCERSTKFVSEVNLGLPDFLYYM